MPHFSSRLYLRFAGEATRKEKLSSFFLTASDGSHHSLWEMLGKNDLLEGTLKPQALKALVEQLAEHCGEVLIAADTLASDQEPTLWQYVWDGDDLSTLVITGPAARSLRNKPLSETHFLSLDDPDHPLEH